MKVVAGFLVVIAHAACFVWLAVHGRGRELEVELRDARSIEGRANIPALTTTDTRPGLQRRRWSVHYRGGFTREVGATQLAGPFQDPSKRACSGRVIVGQRMLDAMTPVVQDTIDAELRGLDVFPIGAYKKIEALSLAWADGRVRASARLFFERGNVALHVSLIPELPGLKFRIEATANLDFNNAVLRWVSNQLGASSLATRVARNELDDLLVTTLAPPPPFELANGQALTFSYCDAPIEIVDGAYAALPFAVAIANAPVLPPHFGAPPRTPPSADTLLALDLDADALNAILAELWRTGWLDQQLAEVGLDRRFNHDPTVTSYLSLRISPPRFALPPVVTPNGPGTLRLAADGRVALRDGAQETTGRVFGALDLRFLPGKNLPVAVELGALELACERSPTTLVPCYGDLVSALRDRGGEFHGALTEAFAKLLATIFIDRHIATPGLPAELQIRGVVPTITTAGTLRLQLDAQLIAR